MKTYHILWFDSKRDIHAKGVNIEAVNMMSALFIFQRRYKGKDPYNITEKW